MEHGGGVLQRIYSVASHRSMSLSDADGPSQLEKLGAGSGRETPRRGLDLAGEVRWQHGERAGRASRGRCGCRAARLLAVAEHGHERAKGVA